MVLLSPVMMPGMKLSESLTKLEFPRWLKYMDDSLYRLSAESSDGTIDWITSVLSVLYYSMADGLQEWKLPVLEHQPFPQYPIGQSQS